MSSRVEDPVQYTQFSGLRNTVSEERLGPSDLAVAKNVDIDDVGQLRRRRGRVLVAAGDFHSLHEATNACFVVKDGDLCQVRDDHNTSVIHAGVGPHPLCYVSVGDDTYFSSLGYSGVVSAGVVSPWGADVSPTNWESPVVNPTQNLPEVAGKVTSAPPTATSLAYLNGRIYLAEDKVLWATELYRYAYVDRTKNYMQFESPIRGVLSVRDGLYVGTDEEVFFLAGTFGDMARRRVVPSGYVPGSGVSVPPAQLGERAGDSKASVFFLTHLGVYAGLDSGVCYPITQEAFLFPSSQTSAAMYRQQDGVGQYVGVMGSSGGPVNNARFGDYVDAEIRRFTGN